MAATAVLWDCLQDTVQLQESPFLMHPVESNTVGLYRGPVAILDFASLYPSIFRAYNMSYDTLLHDSADAAALDPQDIFTTPTGQHSDLMCGRGRVKCARLHCRNHGSGPQTPDRSSRANKEELTRPASSRAGDKFVKPHVREGILPIILSALIEARAVTKRLLKDTEDPAQRAVLSSRQQALKTTANAAYGFTGQHPWNGTAQVLLQHFPRFMLSRQRPGFAGTTAVGQRHVGALCLQVPRPALCSACSWQTHAWRWARRRAGVPGRCSTTSAQRASWALPPKQV